MVRSFWTEPVGVLNQWVDYSHTYLRVHVCRARVAIQHGTESQFSQQGRKGRELRTTFFFVLFRNRQVVFRTKYV